MSSRLHRETRIERQLRKTATKVALQVIDENEPSTLNPEAKPFQLPLLPPSYEEAIAHQTNRHLPRKPLLPTPPRQPAGNHPLQIIQLLPTQHHQQLQPQLHLVYPMQMPQMQMFVFAPTRRNNRRRRSNHNE